MKSYEEDTVVKKITLVFYLLCCCSISVQASDWTRKKAARIKIETNRAVRANDWERAIKLAHNQEEVSKELYGKESKEFIAARVQLSLYYSKARRLPEIADQLEETYSLSKVKLGVSHIDTVTSRFLLYKFYVSSKQYALAIPLVKESLAHLKAGRKRTTRQIRYLNQLRFLYALLDMPEEESEILLDLKLLYEKNSRAYADEELDAVILALATNYCRRNKLIEFTSLVKHYQLYYFCDAPQSRGKLSVQ